MELARDGNVEEFLRITRPIDDELNTRILRRTNDIFRSQKHYLYGSTAEEELKAAAREATVVEEGCTRDDLANAAATKEVMDMVKVLEEIHADSSMKDEIIGNFIKDAYSLKCYFRKGNEEG